MSRQRGFSLIELLIVVAIILIIAAIAIPNFLKSRINANEASAVASLRTIGSAQITYSVNYPQAGYADTLVKLGEPTGGNPVGPNNAGLIDWVLGCSSQPCSKSGYNFAIVNPQGAPVSSYELNATPVNFQVTGVRGFCASQLTVIKFDITGGVACTSPIQ